ncbi:MAG: Na/Pi cotransporter family protein [Clostridia bacterium]|nr:Na/Pi cotransporter family protein [Clostridia bacterium]
MTIANIVALLGGLALFLYGMQMMSTGLEAAAGNRMKNILEKLTSNRFLGVLVGAAITAVIQSSSATTVMVVGFVNSGMMKLRQAVWIIMGANIGTTITAQLITLDIDLIAPVIAFIGVAFIVFLNKPALHNYGAIIGGFGILFIGMEMMSTAMAPLREVPEFVNLMTRFSNPVLGILVGALFTAVIQSSSASVGILQALAAEGLIGLGGAVFVLFGQNIGTCITAVLASIGTNRSAKRTTVIHLLFNLIGTVVFTAVILLVPSFVSLIESWTPGNVSSQIANMHTLFNIASTLLLLPFGGLLAKLATIILPERDDEQPDTQKLLYLKPISSRQQEYHVGTTAIVCNDVRLELERMATMVKENISLCFDSVLTLNGDSMTEIERNEEYIDYLNKEICKYISHHLSLSNNGQDSARLTAYFKIAGNLERVGDHAVNIGEYTALFKSKQISLSGKANAEVEEMKAACETALDYVQNLDYGTTDHLVETGKLEQRMDDMTREYRRNQIARMQAGDCSGEACILYSEMLTDFERIGDHILNIAEALA